MALPEPEPSRVATRWAWAALFAYPPTVALGYILRLSAIDAFVLAALVAPLPLLAVAQVPLAKASLAEATPLDRSSVYLGSAATIFLLGGVALAAGLGEPGRGRARAGNASSPGAPGLELWPAGSGARIDRALPCARTGAGNARVPPSRGAPGLKRCVSVAFSYSCPSWRGWGRRWLSGDMFFLSSRVSGSVRGVRRLLQRYRLAPCTLIRDGGARSVQACWGSLSQRRWSYQGVSGPRSSPTVGIDVVGGLWLGRWLLKPS